MVLIHCSQWHHYHVFISTFQQFYQDGARIEAAFRKYFHRAEKSQETDSYDILVCHANVIRYFVCR
jgi:serine/threonine-protein phosphatase PGAM5